MYMYMYMYRVLHVHVHVQGVTHIIIIMHCVTGIVYIVIITEEYLFTECKGHYKEYFNIQYPSPQKFPINYFSCKFEVSSPQDMS